MIRSRSAARPLLTRVTVHGEPSAVLLATGERLRPPLDDRHSARRGTCRVVHRIDDDTPTVTVLDVAHRRDAYRQRRLTR